MVIVQMLEEPSVIVATMMSPGETGASIVTAAGRSSYQASYVDAPPEVLSTVPVWMRSC